MTDDNMTLRGLHKIGRLHDLISKDVNGDPLHNGHWHNIPTQFCSGGRFLEDIPETTIRRLSAGNTWNSLVWYVLIFVASNHIFSICIGRKRWYTCRIQCCHEAVHFSCLWSLFQMLMDIDLRNWTVHQRPSLALREGTHSRPRLWKQVRNSRNSQETNVNSGG